MLDQILDIVKENAGDLIVNNSDIDNKFNENAISGAAESISKGLQEQLNQGNVKDVLNIFSSKTSNDGNPLIGQLTNMFGSQLGDKFGVQSDKANGIASSLIPVVIEQLVNRVNDKNNSSIDLNSILGGLSGK